MKMERGGGVFRMNFSLEGKVGKGGGNTVPQFVQHTL
jgi:hypothetical protein